jgi:hypothetical protein
MAIIKNSFWRYLSAALVLLLIFYDWFSISDLLSQGTRWGDSRFQRLFNKAKSSDKNIQQYRNFCSQSIGNITKKFDALGESGIGNVLNGYISLHKEVQYFLL